MNPTKFEAVKKLVGGELSQQVDGTIFYHSGQTPPAEKAIQTKLKELQAEYDSQQYQRDRNYPPIGDQLDQLYWDKVDGTEKWKESIDAVKSEYPKSL